MQPTSAQEYQAILTDVIKKQIALLGPAIALARARSVPGLTISDDGTVTSMIGGPEDTTQKLISAFVELSGLIVKKTMEPFFSAQAAPIANPLAA